MEKETQFSKIKQMKRRTLSLMRVIKQRKTNLILLLSDDNGVTKYRIDNAKGAIPLFRQKNSGGVSARLKIWTYSQKTLLEGRQGQLPQGLHHMWVCFPHTIITKIFPYYSSITKEWTHLKLA